MVPLSDVIFSRTTIEPKLVIAMFEKAWVKQLAREPFSLVSVMLPAAASINALEAVKSSSRLTVLIVTSPVLESMLLRATKPS